MTNRTVEAILKISSKLGDMKALKTLQSELRKVDGQAKAFNRSQSIVYGQLRKAGETHASVMRTMRYAAPAAIGFGAKQSLQNFADLERQLTRTGLKLGATRQDMDALKTAAQSTAQRYAVANAAIYETIDAYAETGAELKDIRADIDTIVKAQQAMGAEGRDVVASWDAARKNFGVMSEQAEQFYDILAKGSATGKFEGSDLAKYLPSLLPTASVHGLQGISGTAQLVGALEAMRDRTGTSETAATSMTDFLDKLNSPDVQKNFAKLNIDLPKAMKEARESGDDFFTGMSKILNRATRGDVAKLGQIFGERDSRNFARLLMQDIEGVEERIRVLREQSRGTITFNVKAVNEDALASIDRLSNSWDKLLNSTGSLMDRLGASDRLQDVSTDFDRLNAALKGGWTPLDSIKTWFTDQTAAEVVDGAAWKGGLRTPDQIAKIEAYKAYADSRMQTAATTVQRVPTYGAKLDRNGVPIPVPYKGEGAGSKEDRHPTFEAQFGKDRLPYPVPYRAPLTDEEVKNSIPFYTDAGLRDVPKSLQRPQIPGGEMFTGGFPSAEALKDAIGGAGEQAGQSIEQAARAINEQAREGGSVFRTMLEGVGRQIGAEAATAFKAGVGTMQVKGQMTGVSGNPGRTMPTAGDTPAP